MLWNHSISLSNSREGNLEKKRGRREESETVGKRETKEEKEKHNERKKEI